MCNNNNDYTVILSNFNYVANGRGEKLQRQENTRVQRES